MANKVRLPPRWHIATLVDDGHATMGAAGSIKYGASCHMQLTAFVYDQRLRLAYFERL